MPIDLNFFIIFLTTLLGILAAFYFGFGIVASVRRSGLMKFLSDDKRREEEEKPAVAILLDDPDASKKKGLLRAIPLFDKMQTGLLDAAALGWTVEAFLMFSVVAMIAGVIFGYLLPFLVTRELTMLVLGGVGLVAPYLYALQKRGARIKAFEEQLPEALDFISRAIRAGHAFSVSLEMLASESQDPIRTEFRQVFNEVNLGSSLDAALKGLANRVEIIDVKFFVSAVLLQRETGGNLSEVLGKLAHTIRERFRLKGHVRALTAHGRITASVLSVLPIVVVVMLSMMQPNYLRVFVTDPMGRFLALAAVVAQVLAYIIIKKMVNIKI